MNAILLELDGVRVDATALSWEHVAPCGCVCGLTVVALPPPYRHLVLTEADAWEQSYENPLQRERDRKRGFTMRLARTTDAVDRCRIKCEHHWGIAPIPKPDGMEWVAPGWRADITNRTRLHLVPTERPEWPMTATALCGRSANSWDADEARWRSLVECSRCIRLGGAL